jgi:DNA-binding NarL/FixJ family response regulator
MKQKRRILIAEDHTILREGLRALLSADPELEIAGEVDNGRDAIRAVGSLAPDLVLMDLSMPGTNGIEAISEIKRRSPGTRLLALTVHKAEEYVRETLRAGADGYMLKDSSYNELTLAIKNVLNGKIYLSPDVSGTIISGYLDGGKPQTQRTAWDTVTYREREVLKLIAEGRTNKHIANYLCVSVKTVEKHRANLMKKLDLHNASALTAFAIEKGLLTN